MIGGRSWLLLFYICELTNELTRTCAFSSVFGVERHHSFQRRLARDAVRHTVDGIECVEVPIEINGIGTVTILEATAESQEVLVDMALEEHPSKVNLKLNSGDPYGAVLWPAASAIADRLLMTSDESRGEPLKGMSVLELGAGTGLVSIAASLAGAKEVIATDYESVPLKLLEYAASCLNPKGTDIETAHLDMCDFETALPPGDVVVAADVMYEPKTGSAVARRVVEALRRGSRVLVGDSPGRAGRPAFLQELQRLGISSNDAVFFPVVGRTCSGHRHELICGEGSPSVSDTPKNLPVAVLDLQPDVCFARKDKV